MPFEKKTEIQNGQKHITRFATCDAVILYPSLGCPALVKMEENGAWLEMIIATKTDDLRLAEVAFHLRYAQWDVCHRDRSQYHKLHMYGNYFLKHGDADKSKDLIRISDPYHNTDDRISEDEHANDGFKLQLAHMNAFPWVLKLYREKNYEYLYKVGVNLKDEPGCYVGEKLLNFFWLEREINKLAESKPSLMKVKSDWFNGLLNEKEQKFKTRLSEFGKGAAGDKEIIASPYHPVYVSDKKRLSIGHITDIHLDTRMELYSRSVASMNSRRS